MFTGGLALAGSGSLLLLLLLDARLLPLVAEQRARQFADAAMLVGRAGADSGSSCAPMSAMP